MVRSTGPAVPELRLPTAQVAGLWGKRRALPARAGADGLRVALPDLAGTSNTSFG